MFSTKGSLATSLAILTFFAGGLLNAKPTNEKISLIAKAGKPFVTANKKQTIPLKISLKGYELKNISDRAPVNISLVLDKSGSMEGNKIQQLKEASKAAVDILNAKDSLSLVTYDDKAQVIFPSGNLKNKNQYISAINEIKADGSTALYDGVVNGADEVKKSLQKDKVNRIILISDGMANVGPSSPEELAKLGSSLREKNISVSTVGLGLDYNEDLMNQLAQKSDGNHVFVENADQLTAIFKKEFGDLLSVAAQDVTVKINCSDEVRPVRVLGREADIKGQEIKLNLNQIYSNQEKYVIVEVEVPAKPSGKELKIAEVKVNYFNMQSKSQETLSENISIAYTSSEQLAQTNENKDVMVDYVEQVSVERSQEALKAKDEGRTEDATRILKDNATYLQNNAAVYSAPKLNGMAKDAEEYADKIAAPAGSSQWNQQRKKMVESQSKSINQRGW
jgi:Ca-activated chloride channel family protein